MSFFIPNGPTIPNSGNYKDLTVQALQSDSIVSGSLNSGPNNVGFFQTNPSTQQTLDVNSSTLLTDTVTLLQNYGLAQVPASSVRNVTFQNSTSSTTLQLYLQKGSPRPSIATLIATLAPTDTLVWPIPLT